MSLVTDRTSIVYADVLLRRLPSWLPQVNTVGYSVVFGLAAVNISSSVDRMMLNSLDEIERLSLAQHPSYISSKSSNGLVYQ